MNFGGIVPPLGGLEGDVRRILTPSVARDPCEDMDALIDQIEAGEATCWLVTQGPAILAVVVTEVRGASRKQLFIRHCAGRGARDWIHYLKLIEDWARSIGCDSIALLGRPGWQRMLGWERQAVQLGKAL